MRRTIVAALALSCAAPASAAWDFKVVEDPITDAKRGIASVDEDGNSLVVKCDGNGRGSLYVVVIAKEYLGGTSSPYRTMKYRFDGGEVFPVRAYYNGRIAGLMETDPGKDGSIFIGRLLGSSKLAVQVTSFDNDIYNLVFDTTGATEAVHKAAQACGDTNWI